MLESGGAAAQGDTTLQCVLNYHLKKCIAVEQQRQHNILPVKAVFVLNISMVSGRREEVCGHCTACELSTTVDSSYF